MFGTVPILGTTKEDIIGARDTIIGLVNGELSRLEAEAVIDPHIQERVDEKRNEATTILLMTTMAAGLLIDIKRIADAAEDIAAESAPRDTAVLAGMVRALERRRAARDDDRD